MEEDVFLLDPKTMKINIPESKALKDLKDEQLLLEKLNKIYWVDGGRTIRQINDMKMGFTFMLQRCGPKKLRPSPSLFGRFKEQWLEIKRFREQQAQQRIDIKRQIWDSSFDLRRGVYSRKAYRAPLPLQIIASQ